MIRLGPRLGGGGIQIGGEHKIEFRIGGNLGGVGGATFRKMSVRNVNGVKEIDVEEGGQKIKIVEDPDTGIRMEVTQKKDGKVDTQKYAAKNASELKEKHPAAHKLYEKYSGQGVGGGQIRIGPLGSGFPGLFPGLQDAGGEADMEKAAEEMRKFIEQFIEQQKNLRLAPDERPFEWLEKIEDELDIDLDLDLPPRDAAAGPDAGADVENLQKRIRELEAKAAELKKQIDKKKSPKPAK